MVDTYRYVGLYVILLYAVHTCTCYKTSTSQKLRESFDAYESLVMVLSALFLRSAPFEMTFVQNDLVIRFLFAVGEQKKLWAISVIIIIHYSYASYNLDPGVQRWPAAVAG